MYQVSIDQIAKEMGLVYQGPAGKFVRNVVFDSRQVGQDDLFVAIRGQRVDGHRFIEQAIEAGAAVVAVDEAHAFSSETTGCIIVDDGQQFIQALGKWCRRQFHGPVIAITGSQGKTSTKDLLAQVCEQSHQVVVTKENQNNELGMPLTLTRLDEDTDILIVEMGMTGFGEIDFLCQIAQPTHAIITGIGLVHAEFLGSQQGIARAKTELFKYLPESGTVALRVKDRELVAPYLKECMANVVWCSDENEGGDLVSSQVSLESESSNFDCQMNGVSFHVTLPFAGRHFIDNALLVTAVARAIDISVSDIQNGLGSAVSLSSSRMEMHPLSENRLLINDCYNANPDSMMATLDVLAGYKPRPTIACLGNMYELGQYEQEGHAKVGRHLAELGIDGLICLGSLAEIIGESAIAAGMPSSKVYYVDTNKQVACILEEHAPKDAVILVKGSNSMKMVDVYQAILKNKRML
ncbi:MAG: UDP-N-acetylmuramoyl-tripeptide--D-alanyl-D-alanine ligase [Peptococcaceae bacterium]|nr:UDP-N-acetylmuramoyl-tripeptide--D-alanyl-D-alanine ligase [Peptococcaceae bacterium]